MPQIHRCPKCDARFDPPRAEASECPQCGIWFHKWTVAVPAEAEAVLAAPQDVALPVETAAAASDPIGYFGRVAALLFVAVWGVRLIAMDYRDGEIGRSFMHNILLPIHEAGHIFLMPFGEFMSILGGSFFQVALPLGIGLAFALKNRDDFGAALCLWWAGASLLDLAPYVYDALQPQLTLLGGHTGEDGPHDWIYLLECFGQLQRAHGWGFFVHKLGAIATLAGMAWGAAVLWRQREQLDNARVGR